MSTKTVQQETPDASPQPPPGVEEPARPDTLESVLTALARRAVETFVRDRRLIAAPPADSGPPLNQQAPCFVCIKTLDNQLRGCIGTVEPARATLGEEVVANAVGAATRDPRFRPVVTAELATLRFSVDVLERPEPARLEDLDPKVFGVVVESGDGSRRGLLLPDIEGVETVSRQIQVAARKAGLLPHEPLKLYRFRVRRYKELA